MVTSYLIDEISTYQLNDLPDSESTYDRLISKGVAALSIQELLSVALGDPGRTIEHIQEYGIYSLTALHTIEEMSYTLNLKQKDAASLLVSLELGRRFYGKTHGSLVQVRGIEDVFAHYRNMATLPKEQLRALLINSRYQLVHEELLSVGSIESLHISPRDIFQAAVERRVTAMILVHNHPSNDSTPSKADYDFTKTVIEAGKVLGIHLLDHVIIADGTYSSCMPKGK